MHAYSSTTAATANMNPITQPRRFIALPRLYISFYLLTFTISFFSAEEPNGNDSEAFRNRTEEQLRRPRSDRHGHRRCAGICASAAFAHQPPLRNGYDYETWRNLVIVGTDEFTPGAHIRRRVGVRLHAGRWYSILE
jgi:hypothetical protein